MNPTANPAESAALVSDAELAHQAAEGDRPAFQELYARHAMATWQFAQAVASTPDEAAKAMTDGFVRVLRIVRRGRPAAAEHFRPYILAATYRAAIERAEANGQMTSEEIRPSLGAAAPSDLPADHLLIESFSGLPPRWRAALWLTEAAGLSIDQAAPILGVPLAVASQLATRGHAGLRNRFAHVHRAGELPILGPSLRAAALPVPAGLGGRVEGRWRKVMAAERWRSAGPAGWLAERAPGPLAACAVGLLAIGLISLGVVGERSGDNGFFATSPLAVPAAVGNHETVNLSGNSIPLAPPVARAPARVARVRSGPVTGSVALGAVDRALATTSASGAPANGSESGGLAGFGGSRGGGAGGTSSTTTAPPTSTRPARPSPTTNVPTSPPLLAAASLNLGSGVSASLGLGSCTGLSVASALSLGCPQPPTGPEPGAGLTLLGVPLVTPPPSGSTASTIGSTPITG